VARLPPVAAGFGQLRVHGPHEVGVAADIAAGRVAQRLRRPAELRGRDPDGVAAGQGEPFDLLERLLEGASYLGVTLHQAAVQPCGARPEQRAVAEEPEHSVQCAALLVGQARDHAQCLLGLLRGRHGASLVRGLPRA
jgi:hypothetical protein